MNLLVYIALFYIIVNFGGAVIEKIRIPKIYAALFLGIALSTNTPILALVKTPFIQQLSNIGIFTLLFMLGYSLNFTEMKKQGRLIAKITFWVILSELVVGTFALHFIFDLNWLLSSFIALSFATVGEVALLPILREFKLIKTKLGQTILGVAVLDDIVEIAAFLLVIFYIGSFQSNELVKELMPLVAISLGALTNKFSNNEKFDKVINILALFIFGPFFFFYAGTEANVKIIFDKFFLVVFLTLLIKAAKVTSSYFTARNSLGAKKSIILGISLSIKFSTSIIILILLLQKNLITQELFSVLVGIKILFKFIVPILLTYLLNVWHDDIFKK